MKLKIEKNPDDKFFKEISEKVKNNDGYCPCLAYKDDSTKCMCLDFRNQTEPGFCHCKRYKKVEVKE